MAPLSLIERNRLAAILGLLGSDHAGERDAAALAASKFVQRAGVGWSELLIASAAPAGSGRYSYDQEAPASAAFSANLAACAAQPSKLTVWEADFVADLRRMTRRPSAKQIITLAGIAAKVRRT